MLRFYVKLALSIHGIHSHVLSSSHLVMQSTNISMTSLALSQVPNFKQMDLIVSKTATYKSGTRS